MTSFEIGKNSLNLKCNIWNCCILFLKVAWKNKNFDKFDGFEFFCKKIYYGYLFPNTAYAKIGVDFGRDIFIDRGKMRHHTIEFLKVNVYKV